MYRTKYKTKADFKLNEGSKIIFGRSLDSTHKPEAFAILRGYKNNFFNVLACGINEIDFSPGKYDDFLIEFKKNANKLIKSMPKTILSDQVNMYLDNVAIGDDIRKSILSLNEKEINGLSKSEQDKILRFRKRWRKLRLSSKSNNQGQNE